MVGPIITIGKHNIKSFQITVTVDEQKQATFVAFRDLDPTYAATCLSVARQLYDFADKNRGIYSISVPDSADNYP